MTALTLAAIRAKAERGLFPAPSTETMAYTFAGRQLAARPSKRRANQLAPRRPKANPVAGMTRERLLELHAEHGSWEAVSRALHCDRGVVTRRANALGIETRQQAKHSDAELLEALAKAGTPEGAARLLGMSPGGSFRARLNRLQGRAW